MTKEYLKSDPSKPYRQLIKGLNQVIIEIRQLSKPVIAAINGSVAGAGISLAAACDLRIAATSAKFKQAYTSIGLSPDGAWMLFVPLLIGFGKANELLYLDPTFNADQALEMGLINEVTGDENLESRATEIAKKIASGSRYSNAIVKDLMNKSMFSSLERQLELERQGIISASSTNDYAEGISAFFEKRTPKFE